MRMQQARRLFKTYRGFRKDGETVIEVTTRQPDGAERTEALDPRVDLWNHSPAGFEWGYGGSGPTQLALALLADHLNAPSEDRRDATAEKAIALHQQFKFAVVSGLDPLSWSLTTEEIEASVRAITVRNRVDAGRLAVHSAEVTARL